VEQFIEPIKEMAFEEYQQAIIATLHDWTLTGNQK